MGERNFKVGQFERKLPTGLRGTTPNLDFFLENDNCIIGFESKFIEPLSLTLPKFSDSYKKSFINLCLLATFKS